MKREFFFSEVFLRLTLASYDRNPARLSRIHITGDFAHGE